MISLVAVATLLLASADLAIGTWGTWHTPKTYTCPAGSVRAPRFRSTCTFPPYSNWLKYSDLPYFGWNVPADRMPTTGSGRDFFSLMCNSMNRCTGNSPTTGGYPYNYCTNYYDDKPGKPCLTNSLNGTKGSSGIGEVRTRYKCKSTYIILYVLEYIFDYNRLSADFGVADDWWISFNGQNNQKVIYSPDGNCKTQSITGGVKCAHNWLIKSDSTPVGVLYKLILPLTGVPNPLNIRVHSSYGDTAATYETDLCIVPCSCVNDDPHFTGAHGTRYDFNGLPGKSFCLMSDNDFHVNMHIDGYYDKKAIAPVGEAVTGKAPLRSWIRELMIMWKVDGMVHKLHLKARVGPSAEYGSGYLTAITLDGISQPLLQIGESLDIPVLQLQFKRMADTPYKVGIVASVIEEYALIISEKVDATIQLRPALPVFWTAEDAYVHLNMLFNRIETSEDVHGVLGQTYRNDRNDRNVKFQKIVAQLKHNIEADGATGKGFLDGATTDYVTGSIHTADCKFSRFEESSTMFVESA